MPRAVRLRLRTACQEEPLHDHHTRRSFGLRHVPLTSPRRSLAPLPVHLTRREGARARLGHEVSFRSVGAREVRPTVRGVIMPARSIARCGVCIALLAVSAWITVPLGPVPFTMQTFVLALLPQVMTTRDALFTVVVYLLLGAVGVPVFSGFQGGLGVLLGPTGAISWALRQACPWQAPSRTRARCREGCAAWRAASCCLQ